MQWRITIVSSLSGMPVRTTASWSISRVASAGPARSPGTPTRTGCRVPSNAAARRSGTTGGWSSCSPTKQPAAWSTLVTALIRAGFVVDASWPIQTERDSKGGRWRGPLFVDLAGLQEASGDGPPWLGQQGAVRHACERHPPPPILSTMVRPRWTRSGRVSEQPGRADAPTRRARGARARAGG